MKLKRWMIEAAAIAVAVLMVASMAPRLAQIENGTSPTGQPLFGDFIAFWSAGKATLDGQIAEIHERPVLFEIQKTVATEARFFAPYNSPPPFLFIACLLAMMPYVTSALVFLFSQVAFYLFAFRKLLSDTRALIFPITAPSIVYQFGTLQIAMLVAGVHALVLHCLDKRPRLAGGLIGVMTIKPHLALLWPVFLALSGRWRAFLAAALSTAAIVLAAGLVFGFDAYVRFFHNLSDSQGLISGQRISTPAYASLYANLLGLKAPHALAMGAHIASALAGAGIACLVFLRGDRITGGAAFCAATLLLSPYLFFYDFLILLVGVALLGAPRNRLEALGAVLAWGSGLTVAIGGYFAIPLCPIAAWVVLLNVARRAEIWAPPPAPALQP